MLFSCQKALLLVAVSTVACHDSTAPPVSILGSYALLSINGQGLPAIIQSGGGDTTRVFWSILTLDGAGNATIDEKTRRTRLNQPATEAIATSRYSYRVIGDSIAFDYSPPCPPNALCVGPPGGKLSGSTLTLSYSGNPPPRPPSIYRLLGPD